MTVMEYEKNISLKIIYLTIARHWIKMILCLIIGAAIGAIIAGPIYPKKYTTTGGIVKDEYFNAVQADVQVTETIANETSLQAYYEELNIRNIKHSNGGEITISEIKSGIGLPVNGIKEVYHVSFSSSDYSIVKNVLNVILDKCVPIIYSKYPGEMVGLKVYSYAGDIAKDEGGKKFYLLVPSISFVLCYSVCLIYELHKEKIDSVDDIFDYSKNIYLVRKR